MNRILLTIVALTGLLGSGAASAVPILANQWYEVETQSSGVVGDCAGSCVAIAGAIQIGDGPWTFSGAGVFEFQDAFTRIDRFEVFDFGVSLGFTSVPAGSGSCGNSIAACVADSGASSGAFALGAGAHSITVNNLLQDSGAHLFRFNTMGGRIPEPATAALLGLGLLGMRLRRR